MRNDLLTPAGYLRERGASASHNRSSYAAYKTGSLYKSSHQHGYRKAASPAINQISPNGSFGSRIASRSQVSKKVKSRRRLVLILLAFILVLTVLLPAREAFGGLSLVTSERRAAEQNESVISVVVQEGDTLWSIAKKLEPNKDPREVVDQLSDVRNGRPLVVGETVKWAK